MQKRMANGGGNNNGSPRPSPSAEQQKKRDEARKQRSDSNQDGADGQVNGDSSQRGRKGFGGGANIGQELADLLQSKIAK